MKRAHKYLLSGLIIFLIVALAGIWGTGRVSKQLDVISGKLRIQHTCFGKFPIYTSNSKENSLSSAARVNDETVDWLTIDSDGYYIYNSCGRRDYRTLFSVFYAINLQVVDPNVRQEFARSVLRELKETRSVSLTTRHLLKLLEELRKRKIEESPEAFLVEIWESTTGSSLSPIHPSETERTEFMPPNGP
jgi:hypothetical protein